MYSVCLRYAKNQEDANDIFQQSFFLIYKNIGQLKNPDALSGWIKTIFVNTALEHIRKSVSFIEVSPNGHNVQHEDNNWNEALSRLATEELTGLIQQLPEGYRLVFNLFVIEGFTHKEIAEKLDISVGTSKSQLFDAKKQLKKWIVKHSVYGTKQNALNA